MMINFIFIIFLTIISITDLRSGMIYNKILIPMAILALIFDLTGQLIDVDEAVLGALIGGIILFIIQIASHGGLGGGDVKFAFVLGLWLGLYDVLNALFIATLTASVAGIIIFAVKRTLKVKIPFGPFMSFGALMTFVFKINLLEVI